MRFFARMLLAAVLGGTFLLGDAPLNAATTGNAGPAAIQKDQVAKKKKKKKGNGKKKGKKRGKKKAAAA